MKSFSKKPLTIFSLNIIAIILAYYISLLFHEWGHGTMAWLFGVKNNPFDIQYGGWFLINADENVNYSNLINSGYGFKAPLIGVSGIIVSLVFALVSFILLNLKGFYHNKINYILSYWFLIINMIPLVQYFSVSTFSNKGDIGRFISGLNISGWLIFIPGTIFIIFSIFRIILVELERAYVVIPIKSLLGKNIFLLTTLSFLFLFIYTHGYNPLTDRLMDQFSKLLAIIYILMVPILYILCNPSFNLLKKFSIKLGLLSKR